MLRHESHVFELQVETKFDVCDPCSFLMLLYNLCTTVESLGKKKQQGEGVLSSSLFCQLQLNSILTARETNKNKTIFVV